MSIRMNIVLITPARSQSRSGNRTTAARWARILRALGHRVRVATEYRGERADAMIALHAWRSAGAIGRFHALYPDRPLVVALTGTDIYDFIDRDPARTLPSLDVADRLVALQGLARKRLPARYRDKFRVIHQSAATISRARRSAGRIFDVAVIAQLREVKDPLRAAEAARRLPERSRVRIVHLGAAETATWVERAKAEMTINPRYVWRGERPAADVRRLLGRARALVLSSLNEGGANVVSEAVAAGVPILASRIDGSVGLLGRDYPGYFPVGDTAALARLLRRIETDARFRARLHDAVRRRAHLFSAEREKAAWKALLRELAPEGPKRMRVPAKRRGSPAVGAEA
jgi:putative glycosyltransferase (TIGR04348 family)